jgi:hypothetical protein
VNIEQIYHHLLYWVVSVSLVCDIGWTVLWVVEGDEGSPAITAAAEEVSLSCSCFEQPAQDKCQLRDYVELRDDIVIHLYITAKRDILLHHFRTFRLPS